MSSKIHRRAVLQGLGTSIALLPFVPILDTRAADVGTPRRLVVFFSSNGTIGDAWDPSADLELGPILTPLQGRAHELLFVRGLRMECAFHSAARAHTPATNGCLTGTIAIPNGPDGEGLEHGLADGPSVDQVIAARIGDATKYPSLQLGVGSVAGVGGALGHLVYAGSQQPLLPENDPAAVFDRLFGDAAAPDGALAQRDADRRSVIDLVAGDLERLRGRLGASELTKLDAHLQAVREIEGSLGVGSGPDATSACAVPASPAADLADTEPMDPAVARVQIDLLVMAMACDLTRVASLDIGGGGSAIVHRWLGHTTDHHTFAHDEANSRAELIEINRWNAEQYAYLLDQLAAVPEGDGTMLDHTVAIWVNELATGNHSYDGLRVVMSGGGYFTPGRVITVKGDAFEYNDMLVSLCQAMGLADVASFGDPQFSSGPLAVLQ